MRGGGGLEASGTYEARQRIGDSGVSCIARPIVPDGDHVSEVLSGEHRIRVRGLRYHLQVGCQAGVRRVDADACTVIARVIVAGTSSRQATHALLTSVPAVVATTGTVIAGASALTARVPGRVQVIVVSPAIGKPLEGEQVQPEPVGCALSVRPAGSVSVTVIVLVDLIASGWSARCQRVVKVLVWHDRVY